MTYIITGSCIKDDSCIEVCPVDCIHPTPDAPDFDAAEQLYIDPATCIDNLDYIEQVINSVSERYRHLREKLLQPFL